MHGEVVTERTSTPTESVTSPTTRKIKTQIWQNALTNDGYFLDIFKIVNTTEQQLLQILDQQYKASNFLGIKFLGKNTQRYIKVYPTKDIVDRRFFIEGVIYESKSSKIQLFPCKATDREGKLIQSLSHGYSLPTLSRTVTRTIHDHRCFWQNFRHRS